MQGVEVMMTVVEKEVVEALEVMMVVEVINGRCEDVEEVVEVELMMVLQEEEEVLVLMVVVKMVVEELLV